MASSLAKSHKNFKRMDSKKSHSWWWDSHVCPKNSKWLAENLEEMDHSVKRMLKLIEEDADSFAKKAEMYFQKRPELISHVEEFYRMYRSLAERYDHVTGELRKNIPADLQSQGSGISDVSSEPPSTCPSPDQRLSRRKSGPRAAGFDFFLGTAGNSSDSHNKGNGSCTSDSESESDDSSINNYSGASGSGDEQGLHRKLIELEVELRDVKEKLQLQREDISDGSFRGIQNGNSEVPLTRITGYEEELSVAKEKIRLSEEEIARLRTELQKYESLQFTDNFQDELDLVQKDVKISGAASEVEEKQTTKRQETIEGSETEVLDLESKIQTLEGELKITKEKLHDSENEVAGLRNELESNRYAICQLQDQVGSAQKDIFTWKAKLDKEKREVSKFEDRIVRYKANLSGRDQEIRGLKETISTANESLSQENLQLQAEITKLVKERGYLEDSLKEWDLRCQSLEEDVRRVKAGKAEMEFLFGAEIVQLNGSISERNDRVEELNKNLDAFKLKHDMLIAERDELNAKVATLTAEISCKDDRIDQMNNHLHQLHMEHVELIAGIEGTRKMVEELRSRIRELEREVRKKQEVILGAAEEKREAIRQLCFSLEHYRDGYHQLRQAFMGHKRLPVMAS